MYRWAVGTNVFDDVNLMVHVDSNLATKHKPISSNLCQIFMIVLPKEICVY